MSKSKRNTKVVRIPKEIYKDAETLREQYARHPKNGTDPFAIIAVAGISAFIGGLIGYGIAKLQEEQNLKTPKKKEVKGEDGE